MEVEKTLKSRRLLNDNTQLYADQDGGQHINPAFDDDDSVFDDLIENQFDVSKIVKSVVNAPEKIRKTSSTSENRKGYNKLDDAKDEHPVDTESYSNAQSSGTSNLGKQFSKTSEESNEGQTKETSKSTPVAQRQRKLQCDSLSEREEKKIPTDLTKPRVQFKLGQKHVLERNDLLKDAEKLTFQNNDYLANTKSKQASQTFQIQNESKPTRQTILDNNNFGEKDSSQNSDFEMYDDTLDENNDLYQFSGPQRYWSAYKSAITINPNSLSSFGPKQPFLNFGARSQSMRLPRPKPFSKELEIAPKKLLRQLSFSDSDATNIRDYGSLKGGNSLPRREMKTGAEDPATPEEPCVEELRMQPAALACILGLMEELLARGKIRNVAVLNQTAGDAPVVASLPKSWELTSVFASGLARAVTDRSQMFVRLTLEEKVYVCLKHGPDKMVGHSKDQDVLVALKTDAYLVLGFSDDKIPGSCLHEVSELADILVEKGY
ncbi:hypothetical protein PoB_002169400 [Plakobranchus ocellatus]|uniref:Profilin n=1 Tax=Plakobranchus ocellatus TaxID=259542 RepID=A0AAV3ZIP5_9GAST|nr:hypothetical protein PoB_002169400 [Plakobranchus ocellatus]